MWSPTYRTCINNCQCQILMASRLYIINKKSNEFIKQCLYKLMYIPNTMHGNQYKIATKIWPWVLIRWKGSPVPQPQWIVVYVDVQHSHPVSSAIRRVLLYTICSNTKADLFRSELLELNLGLLYIQYFESVQCEYRLWCDFLVIINSLLYGKIM